MSARSRWKPDHRSLRVYGRLLRFLRPHLGVLLGAFLCMAGFAAFSGFSIAMIVPFTEIVLSGKSPEQLAALHGGTASGGAGALANPQAPGASVGNPTAVGKAPADSAAAPSPSGAPRSAAQTLASARDLGGAGAGLRARAEALFYRLIRGKDRRQTLAHFCLAVILLFLLKNIFAFAQSALSVKVEQEVIRDIRDAVFGHYQTLSLEYFGATNTGTMISRITNDIDLVKGAVANGISDILRQGLLVLVYLITVLLASWKLFLFAAVILPPNLWLIDRIGGSLRRSSRISQTRMARLTALLAETLDGIRVVKAFGLESDRSQRFRQETSGYAGNMIRLTRIGSLASPLTELLGVLVAVLLLWFAGARVAGNAESAGRFLLFLVGMLSMMQPIKILSQTNINIQQGLAAGDRIFEVLDARPRVAEAASPAPVRGFQREIRFENVGFAYRADTQVLFGIDLTIARGETVALVGPSGGGKSTIMDLIPRLHDPTSGRVTLDGVDLRQVRLGDLRRLLGLVSQETMLFEGTLRENISLGNLEATEAEIEAAASAANALEFIRRLPEGLDTDIGPRGTRLSGGQRQRVAIARAVLRNPEILLFDEATSSLDNESELLVQSAIENLLVNRTAVIIAHRLTTVRRADRIVVLDQGRIVQVGRHDELLAQGGLYQRLYEMQFRDLPERSEVAAPPESLPGESS